MLIAVAIASLVPAAAPTGLPFTVRVSANRGFPVTFAPLTGAPLGALTTVPTKLKSAARALSIANEIVWFTPALAPTWNVALFMVPSITFLPLNSVVRAILSSSAVSWITSSLREDLSEALLVSFADCTASSRIRWRIFVLS